MATPGTHPDDACAPDARNGSPASQATVHSLTLAKGASLAGVTMNATSHAPHPPNLVEVQTLLNRVPSLARAQVPKVPSLMELNARAQSPAAVKMIPPGSQAPFPAHPAPTVPALSEREENEEPPAPCAGKVCANCRTMKTPLWRNGPLGPKTLCNACGVRFKLGKLPPPGGWPPGHVPPPPPPRKRPSNASSNGEKGANKRVKHAHAGEGAGNKGTLKSHPQGPAEGRKKGRKPSLIGAGGPDGEYLKARFGGPGRPTLTDYDGAVLLMVLAGMYD